MFRRLTNKPTEGELVSGKNLNLHKWLDFVVTEGQPFNIVESKKLREISKLDPISTDSLMVFMSDMTKYVFVFSHSMLL